MQPLEQVLARVVDLVFEVVPAERAFLLLRDAIDQPLTARVMRHRDGSVPANVSLSRTIVNRVMRERVAMLAKDALYDQRLDASGSIQAMSIRSFMCAPLWNQNDVIGVLYCDNPRSKKFTAEDLEVFAALCNYAAVAIEQARLSLQLLEETRRRERLQRYHSPRRHQPHPARRRQPTARSSRRSATSRSCSATSSASRRCASMPSRRRSASCSTTSSPGWAR